MDCYFRRWIYCKVCILNCNMHCLRTLEFGFCLYINHNSFWNYYVPIIVICNNLSVAFKTCAIQQIWNSDIETSRPKPSRESVNWQNSVVLLIQHIWMSHVLVIMYSKYLLVQDLFDPGMAGPKLGVSM